MTRALMSVVLAMAIAAAVPVSAQPAPEIAFDANVDLLSLPAYGEVAGVATNSKGHIFVYARTGHPVATLGARPSYFNTVHAIAIDKNRRVYIADRANSRIQIFDENGKFIELWPNVRRPYSVLLDENQNFWVADGTTQKFTKFNPEGQLQFSWGTFGAFPGGFSGVHQFSVDSEGNLYTADVHVGRPQKFRPKKGANPAHLIGQYWPVAK